MVGISTHANTCDTSQDVGAALLGVAQAFKHQNAGTFAHHKAVAVLVEGARGGGRVVVALAQGMHVGKTSQGQRVHRLVGTASQHDVGTTQTDSVVGGGDGVVRCSAGTHNRKAGAHPTGTVRNFAGGHVHNGHGDKEGGHTARAAVG